jgi:hypothetical protein
MDDFSMALWRLSNADNLPGIDLAREFILNGKGVRGLHNLNHTIRVVFWVLYLVEISNRLGYPVDENAALAALYAALIHDLQRKNDFPGGKHGQDAARMYRNVLKSHLSPDQLQRCLNAVEYHGFAHEPLLPEPVWMLLKDADALDRARLAPPGAFMGCDPARLRLPVLKENTPVLEGCLAISMLLLELMDDSAVVQEPLKAAAGRLALDLLHATTGGEPGIKEATRLVTDRIQVS